MKEEGNGYRGIKLANIPEAQVLGSAIGMKVMDNVTLLLNI